MIHGRLDDIISSYPPVTGHCEHEDEGLTAKEGRQEPALLGWIAGPGKAHAFRRSVRTTAADLQQRWTEYFVDIGKDFCDLFCRDGRLLSRDEVKSFCRPA
jgi:hypothetical protein